MPPANGQNGPSAVAGVYATALLSLAEPTGSAEAILEQFEQVAAALEAQPEFRELLHSPIVPANRKLASLDRAFRGRVEDAACDALLVIARRGRIALLPQIVAAMRRQLSRRHGRVAVQVTTAVPMDEPTRQTVERQLRAMLGREPEITPRVDAAMVGGLSLRIGDTVIDASIRGQLDRLRRVLRRGPVKA